MLKHQICKIRVDRQTSFLKEDPFVKNIWGKDKLGMIREHVQDKKENIISGSEWS